MRVLFILTSCRSEALGPDQRLVVSLSTVKYHISNILMKLGVDNRLAAVTMAIRKKLV